MEVVSIRLVEIRGVNLEIGEEEIEEQGTYDGALGNSQLRDPPL